MCGGGGEGSGKGVVCVETERKGEEFYPAPEILLQPPGFSKILFQIPSF